jgi:dihydroorotate dehydrogenase electron transfer subunit
MLRVPGRTDPLLGRAFALYDTVAEAGKPAAVDIVYLVVGKMTRLMANLSPGDAVEVWGALGNGFPDYAGIEHLVLVAGGIGQTPFLALIRRVLGQHGYGGQPARREVQHVSLFYGVRTGDLAACIPDFEAAGANVYLASDDGSLGFHGFVTELLKTHHSPLTTHHSPLTNQRWVGCGPEPMMHALASMAQRYGVACDLSLETPMACGVGICFSCVARVRINHGWDYCRVCVDGPVFNAADLVW